MLHYPNLEGEIVSVSCTYFSDSAVSQLKVDYMDKKT